MGNKALIIGGSNGIGLSIVKELLEIGYELVYILDKSEPEDYKDSRIIYKKINLADEDLSILDSISDINTLVITAGFGRVAPFESIHEKEIINIFKVNTISAIRIIKHYYDKLLDNQNFNCAVMGSISGLVSSPLFSVYGSSKAALCSFIESINIELLKKGTHNRILNVSPGSIKGTKFSSDTNDLTVNTGLAQAIIRKMFEKKTIFIPDFTETYKQVLENYRMDSVAFGLQSYDYKIINNRLNLKPQVKIGYLSGTFDLFHVGHLNLLRRAKEYCDYLVVGVHRDASHKNKSVIVPFHHRVEILENIKYVDKVIESYKEDSEAYEEVRFDYLFVGSDYKGTDRFNRYEKYFEDKGVEIIYFPYTDGTSSTQLREVLQIRNM